MKANPYESPTVAGGMLTEEELGASRRHPIWVGMIGMVLGLACGGVSGAVATGLLGFIGGCAESRPYVPYYDDGEEVARPDPPPLWYSIFFAVMGGVLGGVVGAPVGGIHGLAFALLAEHRQRFVSYSAMLFGACLGASLCGSAGSIVADDKLGGDNWLYLGGVLGLIFGMLGGWLFGHGLAWLAGAKTRPADAATTQGAAP